MNNMISDKRFAVNETEEVRVHSTRDYSMFKFMGGNRDVTHSEKIRSSIEKYGLMYQPVLVNEKWEIIDGQGRFTACKELGIPVLYIIQPGLTIEHCRALNIQQTNWDLKDYIASYALKSEDYANLQKLIEKYGSYLPQQVICNVAGGFKNNYTVYGESVKNGDFKCDPGRYEKAVEILDWMLNFRAGATMIGGKSSHLYNALYFCYECEDVSNDQLLKQFNKASRLIKGILSVGDAVEQLETVYNYSVPKKRRVYFSSEYRRTH